MGSGYNAERLERIRNQFEQSLIIFGRYNGRTLFATDIEWLLEQAGRIQKVERQLEEYQKDWPILVPMISRLEEENIRLRGALEKIAASGLDCFENECTYIARRALPGGNNG